MFDLPLLGLRGAASATPALTSAAYCHDGLLTEQVKLPPSIEKTLRQRLAFYFYNMCSLTPLGLEKSSREITRQINYFSQVCWLTFPVRRKLFGNREPINGAYGLLPSSTSGLLIYSISGVTCTNQAAVSSAGRSEGVWGGMKEGVKSFQLWKRRATQSSSVGRTVLFSWSLKAMASWLHRFWLSNWQNSVLVVCKSKYNFPKCLAVLQL